MTNVKTSILLDPLARDKPSTFTTGCSRLVAGLQLPLALKTLKVRSYPSRPLSAVGSAYLL